MGGDSLSATKISTEIQKNFNVKIPAEKLKELNQKEMEDIIKNSKKSNEKIDPFEDSKLDERLLGDLTSRKETKSEEIKNLFLTGSTGFIGPFLVEYILNNTNWNLFCLIRSTDKKSGEIKISKKLRESMLFSKIKNQDLKRINVVIGDISISKFGLKEDEYFDLSSKIDTIIHAASFVNLLYDYEDLRKINVFGTLSIIQFATNQKLKKINYLSTTDVYGSQTKDFSKFKFQEDFELPKENLNLNFGYAITKWVSEKLLVESFRLGVPVTILRLSNVSGDEDTGYSNVDDFISRFLRGLLKMKTLPTYDKENQTFPSFIPVKYLSNVMIKIISNPESNGKAFNCINQNGIPKFDLIRIALQKYFEPKAVEYREWLNMIEKENPLYEISSSFDQNCLPKFGSKQIESDQFKTFTKVSKSPLDYSQLFSKYIFYLKSCENK